jgi:hypothetical protein
MIIKLGQRWKFYNYGIIEIVGIADDKQFYVGKTVQEGNAEAINFTMGKVWELPFWKSDSVIEGWHYLEGQDSPRQI